MNPHAVNQLARDIAAVINQYIGPAGEIVVDTDSWTIRLQDNSTAGGHIFAPLDITDQRYQGRNGFLTNIIGLEGSPGFIYVSATGVGTRALTFSTQFTVDPGVLATDNFGVVIKTTQAGDWTFGSVTAATFTGALTGNTTGTHIGPVQGNVTGNVTGNLTGNSAGLHTGGLDARGATLQFDANQIPNSALSAALQAFLAASGRLPPQWSILLWDSNRAIPSGWQEADGTNGTVDLRGFFPVGASPSDSSFAAGAAGGSKTHTHGDFTSANGGSHTHALAVDATVLSEANLPAHFHGNGISDDNADGILLNGTISNPGGTGGVQSNNGTGKGIYQGKTTVIGSGTGHSHTGNTATHTGHTHLTSIPALESLPPFKVVKFIQRISA